MSVAFWRGGGEPGQRASQFSPLVTASGGSAETPFGGETIDSSGLLFLGPAIRY